MNTVCRMLQRHKAEEHLFVDWAGQTLKIVDPQTGEISQAYVFVTGTSRVRNNSGLSPSQALQLVQPGLVALPTTD